MAHGNSWNKDADALKDYQIDWSKWLDNGDTIAASEWIDVDGVTKENDTSSDTATKIWVSGGPGRATNRITTAGGRIEDQTLYWRIRPQ